MDRLYDFYPTHEAVEQLVGLPAAEVERDLIFATLRCTHGNRTHAAKILGISLRTVRNKLVAYGIADDVKSAIDF